MNTTEVLGRLHDFISKPILFVIFGILCVAFGLVSFILLFHWDRYAIDKSAIVKAQSIFFLGGAAILLIAFISVILY
ncbi:TPA: hypothetical protein DCQ44_01940 [Candidatus Taylorbacteria bacterium]|nr:hypothetical protein [Candidatus Taylorbacteria bacterium]